ncbi:MAG TPA: histidine triad nucleotide-binding protein [Gammaproteobacteria bacterium]|nr:histidine triad nucleotide-binding protein [Gammaproteobacteria bacterium]
MKDCLFCKIANGAIPANIIYRDDTIVAFDDINPQAPQHKIIIPQKHIATLNDLHDEDSELIGQTIQVGTMLAKQLGVANDGYRLVFNCNAGAGQSVFHVHLHLLGGRRLSWPPG